MKKLKCECGHMNPEGTVLCEACGKPIEGNQHIDGNENKKLLNMRYEGSARRSLTYRRSIIDKTWSFFSSVKVGVWLIVIALIASAVGTLLPQEMYIPESAVSRDPAIFYEAQYGMIGKIYYQLGLYNMYDSWWYMILIALIGVSLVICSLDRFIPLRRALNMQKAKRHPNFLSRLRLFSETENVTESEKETVINNLKKQRYNIRIEDGHILAEKGRFSRWGAYVNHIGLIIVLLAAILRMTPLLYLDEYLWIREGETLVIPGTDSEYYLENKEFVLELYDPEDEQYKDAIASAGGIVEKNFQTNVTVFQATPSSVVGSDDQLEPILEDSIRMNHPLKFGGYTLYQAGYQLNEFTNMTFKLYEVDDENETAIDTFKIDLLSPTGEYELDNGFTVKLNQFYPDFFLDDGEPRSETNHPRNPAFAFHVHAPEEEEPEITFAGIGVNLAVTEDNQYKLGIVDFNTHSASGLTVRRDYTLPLFALGGLIFMIGVIQGMYWQHRRIWIHQKDHSILLAGHTNKNWFGIKEDIKKAIQDTNISMVEDQEELEDELS